MRRLIWRFLEDQFFMEREYMKAHREIIRKVCMENAKEKFRK